MAKKKRQPPHEEHEGEPWLLPYSDLMTLLLALFIALFAISQTDQTKLKQMAQAFTRHVNRFTGLTYAESQLQFFQIMTEL